MRLNVYMDVGTWEGPAQLMPNRVLYSVLKGKGCHVIYREFPGSHAPFNWVQAFPEAIIATLGFKSLATSRRAGQVRNRNSKNAVDEAPRGRESFFCPRIRRLR